MQIYTERRLDVRSYQQDDMDFLADMLADPQMVRYIGEGTPKNKDEAKEFLQWIYRTYEHGEDMGFKMLVRTEDNVPVGHAGLVPRELDGQQEIEIGYWIAREYWGKGYATEAAKAFLDYGHYQLGIKRFIAIIQPGNMASRQVAQKIGMQLEKRMVLAGQEVYVYAKN
ncbi:MULTISPECIES: GNAT family N-acetyltransferase [Thalassobacillus]|uniref:GNAT family N-acetyltransferase n=1 Tax=Thalassobacillus TaxID=331971 RepID=UPI000A1CA395|nr:GNAT family N-acetyltransferase [Thalassobacillus devorans]